MYKVVTHTIKEEHFEHPYLAEKGMAIHCNTAPMSSRVVTKPPQDGNVKVKMPLDGDWGGSDCWGEYQAWGDLCVYGKTIIDGDLTVEGTITGRGSISTVLTMDTNPTGNTYTGNVGDLARTSSHMYLCVETDKWVRWPIQDKW